MELLLGVIGIGLSVFSTIVTVYFWLVRANRERPSLKIIAVAPVANAVDRHRSRLHRAKWLKAFAQPDDLVQAKSQAGVGYYYFAVKALVINSSILPNTITTIRVRVRTKEGGWLTLNTAYQLAVEADSGPLAFDASESVRAEPRAPLEPRPIVIAAETGLPLRLLAWLDVLLGDRLFEWDRVDEERQLEAVGKYVAGLLVQPLRMEVDLHTLTGKTFTSPVNTESGMLPPRTELPGLPLPALNPLELKVKRNQRPVMIEALKRILQETAQSDGTFRTELAETTDLEATAFAVLAHRTAGWPLPAEEATRRWLLERQQPDGSFLPGQGHLNPAAPEAKVRNTQLALMALYALGAAPRSDPLPALAEAIRAAFPLKAEEGVSVPPSLAHAVAHAHLLCGRPLPPELDRRLTPLVEPTPVFDPETWKTWEIEETNFHPLRFFRLLRRPVPQPEARLAHVLRTVGRRGSLDHDSWRYQSDGRRYNFAIYAGLWTAHSLVPQSPVAKRLLEEGVAYMVERGHDRAEVVYGGDVHRQVYATLAALILAGELKPQQPLACDPHLFGLGEHMPT